MWACFMFSTDKLLEVNKLIYKKRLLSSDKIVDIFVSLHFQYFLLFIHYNKVT